MMIYWARVRYRNSGNEKVLEYQSEAIRAFALLALTPFVEVLSEGVSGPEVH